MVENRQRDSWEKLQLKVFFGAYTAWAQTLCAPVFWRKEDGHMTNGTMTYLRTRSDVLGITNWHVAEAISNHNDGSGWQLGSAQFDPARLIARHPTLDLATFRLSDVFLATSGHAAATVLAWPPVPPSEGDPVLFGGYPGIYREERVGNVDFGVSWFATKVESISERTAGMVLNLANSESLTPRRIAPHAELGGCSGGPVFRVIDSDGIERLELAAIIYEYSSDYEIMRAHPLNSLAEDGSFTG